MSILKHLHAAQNRQTTSVVHPGGARSTSQPDPSEQAGEEFINLLVMPPMTQRNRDDKILCLVVYRIPNRV